MTLNSTISRVLAPDLSGADAQNSQESLLRMLPLVTGGNRDLVFFVGAGASVSAPASLPAVQDILSGLLVAALMRGGQPTDNGGKPVANAVNQVVKRLGFEITLNDLQEISPDAVLKVYQELAQAEESRLPNSVHSFLAYWLATGGIVLTTNFDRFIERAHPDPSTLLVRIREPKDGVQRTADSFAAWGDDLKRGGCLFKLHGSFEDPESCLGVLSEVRTSLRGERAKLLAHILRDEPRPVCFIGWRGVDPDIPPLLADFAAARPPTAPPIFWVHYEGAPPVSIKLADSIEECTESVRPLASAHPILTDAGRLCEELHRLLGGTPMPTQLLRPPSPLDLHSPIEDCTPSGAARFAGIALRRGRQFSAAISTLETAQKCPGTPEEQSAARYELALTYYDRSKVGDHRRARQLLERATPASSDLGILLNWHFGLYSMTLEASAWQPWLILRERPLRRSLEMTISAAEAANESQTRTALFAALLNLHRARLRLRWGGPFMHFSRRIREWVLEPALQAKAYIERAEDAHVPSRVSVLSHQARLMVALGRYDEALALVPEVERLSRVTTNWAQHEHWTRLRRKIERRGRRPRRS